jgi:hypothetical protein
MAGPLLSAVVQPPVTVTAGSAYASGNDVGGILTLAGAVGATKGAGVLQSLTVTDASNQKAPLTVFLFAAPRVAPTRTRRPWRSPPPTWPTAWAW